MGKFLKRLFVTLVILAVLAGGALWWLLSYIAPERELDMKYDVIDVRAKAMDMVKQLKPELVLTERDINYLIKMNLPRDIADNVMLEGADFQLEGDRLLAELNVTYMNRVPAQVMAEYRMEWQRTELALRPQLLRVKSFDLPLSMLETIVVPLDLPTGDMVRVEDISFEADQIKVLFKLSLPF